MNIRIIFIFPIIILSTIGISPVKSSAYISDIAVDSVGIPFILDDKGFVWAFGQPYSLDFAKKIIGLKNIVQIGPYIARDQSGRVFTWGIDKKKSHWSGIGELKAEYSRASLLKLNYNISFISAIMNHFVAIGNENKIIEWGDFIEYGGKVEKSAPKITSVKSNLATVATSGFSTIALTDDGTVLGWGINNGQLGAEDQIMVDRERPGSFKPSTKPLTIYATSDHAIVLTGTGEALFWGSCAGTPYDRTLPHISEKNISTNNIAEVAPSLEDNMTPDVFLRRDGSIWLEYAPGPEGVHSNTCGRLFEGGASALNVGGMSVAATKIATGGSSDIPYTIFALGTDHSLWGAAFARGRRRFTKLFKELPSGEVNHGN